MAVMTGAQTLTNLIKNYGTDTVFALPGAQLNHLFDAFYHERDSIRVIHTRHEEAAAYMAFGYAQSTGRVGTCAVVPGAGVLGTGAALSTAYSCNTPVLCLTGQIPSEFIGKGLGLLHELDDQSGSMKSVVKWSGRPERVGQTQGIIDQAFIHLNSGRRRPVLVEMAPDVMKEEGDVDLKEAIQDFSVYDPDPDPDLINQAASVLGKAKNPGIFVGGGIFGAEEELLEVAEEIQAPVFMSMNGLGAVDQRHYLGHNFSVAYEMWPMLDVILVVGTRFASPFYKWGIGDGVRLIRIDIDPNQWKDKRDQDIHIVSSAKKALSELVNRAGRYNKKRLSREAELNRLKRRDADKCSKFSPNHEYNQVIRRVLPEDGIVCFGITMMSTYSLHWFPVYKPRTIIQPGYQGALGYAFPSALGAQVANPERKVIAVTGDGGFMYNVQELATASQHNINLVTVLFNNSSYGCVRRHQEVKFGGRYIAVDLQNPDFLKLADAFGVIGMQVTSPDELENALNKAFMADTPVLIEVPIKKMSSFLSAVPLLM